jgi:hypothetical protein
MSAPVIVQKDTMKRRMLVQTASGVGRLRRQLAGGAFCGAERINFRGQSAGWKELDVPSGDQGATRFRR